jgi:hypothetical protein
MHILGKLHIQTTSTLTLWRTKNQKQYDITFLSNAARYHCFVWTLPGSARFSFRWLNDDEYEYGALTEWQWQR